MADKHDPKNSKDGLKIEDMGIPLDDVEDDPILLDKAIAEDPAADSEDHCREHDPEADVSEGIHGGIMEDQDDDLVPLALDEDFSVDECIPPPGEDNDGDILPLAELDDSTDDPDTAALKLSPAEGSFNAEQLSQICQQLENLKIEFQGKLKYDAHKEKIIDALHQELQNYKENLMRKLMMSTFKDIIKIIDDIKKMIHHFVTKGTIAEDPGKVLSFLEAVPSDLEDVLMYQGVNPFTSSKVEFDPACQRMMGKVLTNEPDKDKTIAEHVRPGYKHEEHIIRPELVNVFVYSDEADGLETRSFDE